MAKDQKLYIFSFPDSETTEDEGGEQFESREDSGDADDHRGTMFHSVHVVNIQPQQLASLYLTWLSLTKHFI